MHRALPVSKLPREGDSRWLVYQLEKKKLG